MLQEIIELQNSAVEKLVALTRQNAKNVYTFRAPTGSGKTYMMADYMNRLLQGQFGCCIFSVVII